MGNDTDRSKTITEEALDEAFSAIHQAFAEEAREGASEHTIKLIKQAQYQLSVAKEVQQGILKDREPRPVLMGQEPVEENEHPYLRMWRADHIYNRQRDLVHEFSKALKEFFTRETGMQPRLSSYFKQREEDGSINFYMEAVTEQSGKVMLTCTVSPDDAHKPDGL